MFWHNSNKDGGKHNNSKDKFGSGAQVTTPTTPSNNTPGDGNAVRFYYFFLEGIVKIKVLMRFFF